MLTCLALAGPTSAVELGTLPLVACAAIRVHRYWRSWLQLVGQPLMLLGLAWIALGGLSRFWTAGSPGAWLDEFGTARWMIVVLALWPISDRRALLLGALATGFALAQLSQLSHALGTALDIPALTWDRLPGRNSGWWDPVVGGSLLTAILGLHLPAALWGKGFWRVLGLLGTGITLLGILATGTRGAWIASAGLIVVVLLTAALRTHPRRRIVKPGLVLLGIIALGGLIASLTIGDQIKSRFDAGYTEVARALHEHEYTTDTGARIMLNTWAIQALGEHPIAGVGLGGYEAWCRAHVISQGIDPASRNYHAHAHNALLQVGATLGIPGLLIGIAFVVLMLVGSFDRQPGDGPPGYADGPAFAILGLLLVSVFDSIQVNAQTMGLLSVLTLFALQQRPIPARWQSTYPLAS